jgi:hypothetical protein
MPSVTTWNRIEPRSRSVDLTAGLEARVHDPLWFLARQWQVGEFESRNAGSPVMATVQTSVALLDRFSVAGQSAQVYDGSRPIEVLVQQEAVRPASASGDYRQASEAGLYFARLLSAAQAPPTILAAYLAEYPLARATGNAQTISSIVAGRVIDGIKLHADLVAAGNNLPASPVIPADQHDRVLGVTRSWLAWYGNLFREPAQGQSVGWQSDRMEYGFAMGVAEGTDSYTAREYDGGAVDWFTFDRSASPMGGTGTGATQPTTSSKSVMVAPVTFRGMPARRFWEMEDASANISRLSAAAEDLGRLLLREFALIYGNDWFQFPLAVPVGSRVDITGLSVADTFGVVTPIPHYSVADGAGGKWRMFDQSPADPSGSVSTTLLITPGAVVPVDGAGIEEALMLRDELANMVWGIERTVVGASGQSLDRTTAWNTNLPVTPPPAGGDGVLPRYRLGSNVPDYWVPYVLLVPTDATHAAQLRRGVLSTSASGGALGQLLGAVVFLEEVPREGVLLERRYRCARGPDGLTHLWIGRQRLVGKGEGRSGLRFDFLE